MTVMFSPPRPKTTRPTRTTGTLEMEAPNADCLPAGEQNRRDEEDACRVKEDVEVAADKGEHHVRQRIDRRTVQTSFHHCRREA